MTDEYVSPESRASFHQRRHRTVVASDVAVRKSGREAPRVVGGQSGCQSPLPFPEPLDGATVSLRQNRAAGAQVRALRCVVIAKHLFQRQVKVREIPIVGLGETQIDAVSPRYPVARQGDCLILCPGVRLLVGRPAVDVQRQRRAMLDTYRPRSSCRDEPSARTPAADRPTSAFQFLVVLDATLRPFAAPAFAARLRV